MNDDSNVQAPIRILLLEDNSADAALTLMALTRASLQVAATVVDTAAQFMERVSMQEPDVILCDFGLRGWNGLDALRWTRASGYQGPFVYVSGTIGEELAVECMKEGATDYVLKANLARLPHAIRRALSEEKVRVERDRALRQIDDWEQRFATAFRASPDGITIMRLTDGRYVEANDAFLRLTGHERAEVIGRTAGELGLWADPTQYAALLEKLDRGQPVRRHEARFRTGSGATRHIEQSAERIEIQATPCLLAITRDVTDLRLLEGQLLQSQKMEAVGRLAGGIAHDFNNILGVIIGHSQIMLRRVPSDDAMRPRLEQVLSASERAAALTHQLLAFSRKQILETRVLDLNGIVDGLNSMLCRLLGEDVELSFRRGDALGRIKADPTQVEQILMNLVVNARDAMPHGGRLVIETANAEMDAEHVRVHAGAAAGLYICLAVSDTGHGMTREVQARIFEPFFTTKDAGKGTGLGLATVYGIVKQSGGFVYLYSEPGLGTTFKIYLPRVDSLLEERTEPAPAAGGSETVLLVEDDVNLRDLLSELMKDDGYTVLSAESPTRAIEISERHAGPIHVLLTDVVMPGMSGQEVAHRLKEQRADIRVLFMSGYTEDAIVHRGVLEAGAVLIVKPFTQESLRRRLRQALTPPSPAPPGDP